MDSLQQLGKEIRGINITNGWNIVHHDHWFEPYKIPAIVALIHSEASEALEAFRVHDKEEFLVEMADVLIRVLDCACGLTDDFDSIVRAKIEKNATRGYKHGGKRV